MQSREVAHCYRQRIVVAVDNRSETADMSWTGECDDDLLGQISAQSIDCLVTAPLIPQLMQLDCS